MRRGENHEKYRLPPPPTMITSSKSTGPINESYENGEEDCLPPLYSTSLQRPSDAPVPGRPRRRGTLSIAKKGNKTNKNKIRRKKRRFSSIFEVPLAIAIWYILGVFSITSSKILMSSMNIRPFWLTCQQFVVGIGFLNVIIMNDFLTEFSSKNLKSSPKFSFQNLSFSSSSKKSINSKAFPTQLFLVALFFALGFLTTNLSFNDTTPSLVETIKAAEPITSAVLATLWGIETLSYQEVASLIVIVCGLVLSTMSTVNKPSFSSTFHISISTILFILASNLCFSFRGLYQKLLRDLTSFQVEHFPDEILQYRMQQIGFLCLLVPTIIIDMPTILSQLFKSNSVSSFSLLTYIILSLLNGIAFASYNLASTFVLTRLSVVHHAALNCLRRVFAIVTTSLAFNVPITIVSTIGILISVLGFMSFTHFKMQRLKQPRPLSSLLPLSAM